MKRPLRLVLFAVFAIVATLIVAAPPLPFWGERHTPHLHMPPLLLSSGHTLSQTFRFEQDSVDTVVLWIEAAPEKLPASGGLSLTVETRSETWEQRVTFRDVPPSGIVPFVFASPIRGLRGAEGVIRVRLTEPGQRIFLKYQIAAGIYPDGRLLINGREQQGDLAFQVRYLRPALGSSLAHGGYAAAVLAAGTLVALMLRTASAGAERHERRSWALPCAVGLVISGFYGWFLLRPGGYWVGASDFSKDAAYLATGADALRHGRWPVWSHVTCGGMAALGNPEGNTLSLGTLLAGVLPPDRALLALLTFEAGLGAAGAVVLGRTLGFSTAACVVVAVVSLLSASFAYRMVEGLTPVGGAVAFLPWTFAALTRALRGFSGPWAFLAGTALAAMFLRGDVHVVVGAAITVAVWCFSASIGHRSWRPLAVLAGIGATAGLWGSLKILPYLEQPALVGGELPPYVVPLARAGLLDDAFFGLHDRTRTVLPLHEKRPETWGNFGMYVGVFSLVLGGIGLLTKHPYRAPVALAALTAFLLSEGTIFEDVLRHVPPLDVLLRIPSRLWSIFTLFLGLLAGIGIDRITRSIPGFSRHAAAAAILGALTMNLGSATATVLTENLSWNHTPAALVPKGPTHAPHANVSPTHERHATKLLRAGFLLPRVCGDQNNPPIFVKGLPESAPVSSVPSTILPNQVLLSSPAGPADITLRERFTSSWVSSVGTVLEHHDGSVHLVTASGPPQRITLTYHDPLRRAEQALAVALLLSLFLATARLVPRQSRAE